MQINNDIISNTMRHLFATTDTVVLDRSARLQSTGISATDLVTDMFTAIRALPDKQSSSNPLPASRQCQYPFTVLCWVLQLFFSYWLSSDVVQVSVHHATLKEVWPWPGQPKVISSNHQLLVLWKLLERIVTGELVNYLARLLPELQSAYQVH